MTNIAQRLMGLFMALFLLLSFGALPAQAQVQEQFRVTFEITKCEANFPSPCGGGIVRLEQGDFAEPRVSNEAEQVNVPDNVGDFPEESVPASAVGNDFAQLWEWLSQLSQGTWILIGLIAVALLLWIVVARVNRRRRARSAVVAKDDCAEWLPGHVRIIRLVREHPVRVARTELVGGRKVRMYTTPFTTGTDVVPEGDALEDHLWREGK